MTSTLDTLLNWDIKIIGITDRRYMGDDFLGSIRKVIKGGVKVIEFREKDIISTRVFFEKAKEILDLCREEGAALIINDRMDIALGIGSDGLHVGGEDLPVEVVKKHFHGFVGVTVRNEKDAMYAEKLGADYVGAGSVFQSRTKDAPVVGLETLKRIKQSVKIPVIAVGGITLENVTEVLNTGVDGIAVSRALFYGNPEDNARRFREIMEKVCQ